MRGIFISRREMLASGVAALAVPTMPALPFSSGAGAQTVAAGAASSAVNAGLVPFVDVHCHAFNVTDLPVADYLNHGIIREKILPTLAGPLVKWKRGSNDSALQKGLAYFDRVVKALTPTAQHEFNALSSGGILDARTDHEKLRLILVAMKISKAPFELVRPVEVAKLLEPKGFFADLLEWIADADGKETQAYKLLNLFLAAKEDGQIEQAAHNLVEFVSKVDVLGEPDTINRAAGYYGMAAAQFTHPRSKLIDELAELYTAKDNRLQVYTPAMNDFNFWLRDTQSDPAKSNSPPVTEIGDQVKLLSKISRTQPGNRIVHGFIAFDPLRQVVDALASGAKPERTALEWVRRAIEVEGFLGVKVYPPMGFQPIGNVDLADREIAEERLRDRHKPFGRRAAEVFGRLGVRSVRVQGAALDEALLSLYDYCNRNHVPIMAHCSRTLGTFGESDALNTYNPRWYTAAAGSHPKYWHDVLQLFPTLRLNFGHAGGIWCLGARRRNHDEFMGVCQLDSGFLADRDDRSELSRARIHSPWPVEIFKLMSKTDGPQGCELGPLKFPNVYADISDWAEPADILLLEEILAGERTNTANPSPADHARWTKQKADIDKKDKSVRGAFEYLAKFMDDKAFGMSPHIRSDVIRKRVMYGTDWIVMGRHNGARRYFEAINRRMKPVFDQHKGSEADFFGGNALRFMGLTKAAPSAPTGQRPGNESLPSEIRNKLSVPGVNLGTTPRQRLEMYYEANGLKAKAVTIFAAIDTVAPETWPSGACT
jgi:predicted TIM-barrel fold metal-dependent hydrolase